MTHDASFSLAAPTTELDTRQRIGLAVFGLGLLSLLVAWAMDGGSPVLASSLGFGLTIGGGLIYFWAKYLGKPAGIRNDGLTFSPTTSKGWIGWILGVVFTGFYVLLYWIPGTLEGLIRITDPLSYTLRGKAADQWFPYGTFYTIAVLTMGVRMIFKYRHSKYQIIRTLSVMFFQLGFGFTIPGLLVMFNQPEFYFSYFWPLKYDYLFPGTVNYLTQSGGVGVFMIFWGAVMTFIATPVLTYFFGKRWYCSWVCGCGGLAETLGDPYRQLSDKSMKAWKIERWMIHSVLLWVTVLTAALWINSAMDGALLGKASRTYSKVYGFVIGAAFSGVIGVGFYPIMGSRVWCRFGCPMAAILGLQQRFFSRFRISTNGGQCISCGNCSKYCEMGIDVRWYAQRGQNIVRASCVGCGVCSAVCPRGVLNLENGPRGDQRFNSPGPVFISTDSVRVLTEEPGAQSTDLAVSK
ncbi:MAG: 4Fe-4S dicluster domain-containing protein [Bacteroidota bacterium]